MPKSVMINQFKQLPEVRYQRNTFDCSFSTLTTMDAGNLYPVMFYEVVPGQTLKIESSVFGRIETLIVPSYVNIYADLHLWYTPNRLVWDNWSAFLGESWNPYSSTKIDTSTLVTPIVNPDTPASGFKRLGFFDYISIPPEVANQWCVAFYPRSYNLIWNCFYRSEQLQDCVEVPIGDGPDTESDYNLLPRGKRFDYFTSTLPEPQYGEAVYLPLGTSAPVVSAGTMQRDEHWIADMSGRSVSTFSQAFSNGNFPNSGNWTGLIVQGLKNPSSVAPYLAADLSHATGITIQTMRNIIALNQFQEKENRYGTRIQELILAHFGVTTPDYRLQMPEYLGGATYRINVSSVPQTSASSTDNTPQANLSAYGTFSGSDLLCYRSFVEHGTILGLLSIRADLQYQQGVDRKLRRRQKLDYLFPEFAGISDQEVYNYEIYVDGTDADSEIFGYNERYAEYRYHNSYVTGCMRSSYPQSLDIWHLAQYWDSRPQLNSDFIKENPPMDRIIAVRSTEDSYRPQFTVDCYFDVEDTLPLPLFGIPGLERL